MRMIDQIIAYNKEFVAQKGYEKYLTDILRPVAGHYPFLQTWYSKDSCDW